MTKFGKAMDSSMGERLVQLNGKDIAIMKL